VFVQGPPPAPLTSTPPHAPEAPPRRWPPFMVGGAGIALVGAGTVLALSVGGDYDNLKKTCAPSCAQSSYSSLQTRANIGYVLIGVGAAAVAAGTIWYLLQPSGAPESRRAWIAPSPNGIVVGGVF